MRHNLFRASCCNLIVLFIYRSILQNCDLTHSIKMKKFLLLWLVAVVLLDIASAVPWGGSGGGGGGGGGSGGGGGGGGRKK